MPIFFGTKLGMTTLTSPEGTVTPVTAVRIEPAEITQVKTSENDGYSAVQVGAFAKKEVLRGQKSSPQKYKHYLEARTDATQSFEPGAQLTAKDLEDIQLVKVTGVSKGKGFAGTIRRHNHSRGPESHGGKYIRAVGGTSGATKPGRVFPGKKMPGHMGAEKTTLKNRKVEKIDAENNVVFVRGGLPGSKNGILVLRKQS